MNELPDDSDPESGDRPAGLSHPGVASRIPAANALTLVKFPVTKGIGSPNVGGAMGGARERGERSPDPEGRASRISPEWGLGARAAGVSIPPQFHRQGRFDEFPVFRAATNR